MKSKEIMTLYVKDILCLFYTVAQEVNIIRICRIELGLSPVMKIVVIGETCSRESVQQKEDVCVDLSVNQ